MSVGKFFPVDGKFLPAPQSREQFPFNYGDKSIGNLPRCASVTKLARALLLLV